MEYSIFDKIASSAEMKGQIENGIKNSKLSFKQALEEYYTFDFLPRFKVKKEQAIAINLHNRQAIDEFYFANTRQFYNMAYSCTRRAGGALLKNYVRDMVQQVYIDCRYYDFSTEKILIKDIYTTCRTVINGGILHVKEKHTDKKAKCSIDTIILFHNSKMDSGTSLLDYLSAPDEIYNPETLYIKNEEKNEQQYKEEMYKSLAEALPKSQRQKFFDYLRCEND